MDAHAEVALRHAVDAWFEVVNPVAAEARRKDIIRLADRTPGGHEYVSRRIEHLEATRCNEHPAFEPDNCPRCGSSAVIR